MACHKHALSYPLGHKIAVRLRKRIDRNRTLPRKDIGAGAFSHVSFSPFRSATYPTKTGAVVVALSIAFGIAAYNTSSNILYIALALFLSSMLTSGVLSSINFSRLAWKLVIPERMRVDSEATPGLRVRNRKMRMPSFAMWFLMRARKDGRIARLTSPSAIPAGSVDCMVIWDFVPRIRGMEVFELKRLESSFPFGFLRKHITCNSGTKECIVWPPRVPYDFTPRGTGGNHALKQDILHRNGGWELVGLRDYMHGDPVQQVHWKATAKMNRLVVRESADEEGAVLSLWVDASTHIWSDAVQRELMISTAASMAEDLHQSGMLAWAGIAGGLVLSLRSHADLFNFIDALSCIPDGETANAAQPSRRNMVTFCPASEGRVGIRINGKEAGDA